MVSSKMITAFAHLTQTPLFGIAYSQTFLHFTSTKKMTSPSTLLPMASIQSSNRFKVIGSPKRVL
jgi:hypothetical protein